jgi:hypothetical protein
MATKILSPWFCDTDTWRDVVKHNPPIDHVVFEIQTDETWLPAVLVEAGFFPSGNMVKKNQPKLWRDLVPGEIVSLSWAEIRIIR